MPDNFPDMDTNEKNGSGRASYTEEERRELMDEFKSSGLTQASFCREWNINPKTLARWLRAERQENEVSFCEVELQQDHPVTDDLKIRLTNGIEVLVKIETTEDLGRVLREVAGCLD